MLSNLFEFSETGSAGKFYAQKQRLLNNFEVRNKFQKPVI